VEKTVEFTQKQSHEIVSLLRGPIPQEIEVVHVLCAFPYGWPIMDWSLCLVSALRSSSVAFIDVTRQLNAHEAQN